MGNKQDKEGLRHGEYTFNLSMYLDCLYVQKRWYTHGVLHRDGEPAIVGYLPGNETNPKFEIYVQNGIVYRPVPAGEDVDKYPSMTFHGARFWHSSEGAILRAIGVSGEGVINERTTVTFPSETIMRFDSRGFIGGGKHPGFENERLMEFWVGSWCIRTVNLLHVVRNPTVTDTPASTPEEACGVCLVNKKIIAFGPCGHVWCRECASKVQACPYCSAKITSRLRIYT
jgi:hypothetical protein